MVLVDGFMCGDCVGRCEITAESVELVDDEDMLSYVMDGYLDFWFVAWCGWLCEGCYASEWTGMWDCLFVCGFKEVGKEGSCKRTTFLALL